MANEPTDQNNRAGQPIQQTPAVASQDQFNLVLANSSGMSLDVIRYVNGTPQVLGNLANGNQAQILTGIGDELYFGADGRLLGSHRVLAGQSARLEISPEFFTASVPTSDDQQPAEAALVSSQELSAAELFLCEDGTQIEVQLDNRAVETIAIIKSDGATTNLIQVISGSGSRYSNGDYEFHVKADDAVYRSYDVTTNCTAK